MVHNFGIIGGAARRVPVALQERDPQVPWDEVRGMRNVVIHEYMVVSPAVIWQTVDRDLPPLKPTLRKILEDEEA